MTTDTDDAIELRFATFDAAWKRALRLARDHEYTYLVIAVPGQACPYIVAEEAGQSGAIAIVNPDPAEALVLTFTGRHVIPIAPCLPHAGNDQ